MAYDPEKHHRRSLRLEGFDYARPGGYFVTVCAHKRRPLFGCVVQGDVVLNARGEAVREGWRELPQHFPQVKLDAFVVMPNHLHGIVIINEQACEDAVGGVGAQHAVPLQSSRAAPGGAFRRPAPGSLPVVIRSFKSAVTRRIRRDARASRLCIWQRGYYEHVIRSNADLDEIRRYIAENPAKWETDAENPDGA